MGDAIRELLRERVTLLPTTEYLDEAAASVHRIVVVDHGRVIADATPLELKEASHLSVSNRQKQTTIPSGPWPVGNFDFRLELALAHSKGAVDEFVSQVSSGRVIR